MSSTVINIEHVHTLILGEVGRGVPPEALEDVGYKIPESVLKESEGINVSQGAVDQARMQAVAEVVEPIPDDVKPNVRKAHLLRAMKTAAKLRMYRGGVTTHQPTAIKDLEAVEDCLERADVNFTASLAKACANCAFRGNCSLQGRPEAWLDAHPTSKESRTNKKQQTFPEFKESLGINPMAHCVPTRNHQHKQKLA